MVMDTNIAREDLSRWCKFPWCRILILCSLHRKELDVSKFLPNVEWRFHLWNTDCSVWKIHKWHAFFMLQWPKQWETPVFIACKRVDSKNSMSIPTDACIRTLYMKRRVIILCELTIRPMYAEKPCILLHLLYKYFSCFSLLLPNLGDASRW